jgi:hypothetical protein
MARRTLDFQTIRSEGGLLPPDLLRRVLDPKEKLDGTWPGDNALRTGILGAYMMLPMSPGAAAS